MGHQNKQPGFTIVELLIVVVVIAILAAITIVAFNGIQNRAKTSALQNLVSQANKKVLAHAVVSNDTPPSDLAAVGIVNSDTATYGYAVDSTASPNLYCISATNGPLSYAMANKSNSFIEGRCVNNRVFNPGFETNVTSWSAAGTAGSVLTRDTSEWHTGTASMRVVTSGASSTQGAFTSTRATVQPDTTYTASIWMKGAVGRTLRIEFGEMDNTSTLVGSRTGSPVITTNGEWQRHTVTRTMSATASTADIVIRSTTAPAHTFFVDSAMISEGNQQYVYADGDSPGWSWRSTVHGSTSLGPVTLLP